MVSKSQQTRTIFLIAVGLLSLTAQVQGQDQYLNIDKSSSQCSEKTKFFDSTEL